MLINALVEIRDTFAFPADDPVDDSELQAKNRVTLSKVADIEVTPGLYLTRTQGPRSWQVYSVLYDVPDERTFEREIERFKSENAGDTDVLGAWHVADGRQVGTKPVYGEVLRDVQIVDPAWDGVVPQVPNPNYQADPWNGEPEMIDDPTFTPPTITVQQPFTDVIGYEGQPLFPVPGKLSNFMPPDLDADGNPVPNSTVRDINIFAGQAARVYS